MLRFLFCCEKFADVAWDKQAPFGDWTLTSPVAEAFWLMQRVTTVAEAFGRGTDFCRLCLRRRLLKAVSETRLAKPASETKGSEACALRHSLLKAVSEAQASECFARDTDF